MPEQILLGRARTVANRITLTNHRSRRVIRMQERVPGIPRGPRTLPVRASKSPSAQAKDKAGRQGDPVIVPVRD